MIPLQITKLVRAIGEPAQRFAEDRLRMLRAVRFATVLDYQIHSETWKALLANAPSINQISAERIRDELVRIFVSPNRVRGWDLLDASGLMEAVLPELDVMKGVLQPEQFHPEGDVFVHTRLMLEMLPQEVSVPLVFAVLFHDVAKPVTARVDKTGRIRFNEHDRIGAEMTEAIMRRLRFSGAEIEATVEMVRQHMVFKDVPKMRVAKLKRFMARPTFKEELELHYQPIIDLRRNAITGFEALARWRHPLKGMVPPAVFIPVAEDTGLIIALGTWALRQACRTAARWRDDLKIAVNLSPVQFSAPDLYNTVKSVLAETGLAPQRLELEITERLFIEDSEKTLSTLHRLKQLGVRIAMDDFGTGYSSLSYLRSFPYDMIKVDRAFVSDLAAGTEHAVIVQAVVSIARALGMTTTAEGVETDAQKEYLTALGCDQAQGYLFSRPVPVEQVPAVIAAWSAAETLAA